MKTNKNILHSFLQVAFCCCIILSLTIHSAYSQQMQNMNNDSSGREQSMTEEEVAHPFFTHMGMPEAVGMYSLRLTALSTQMDEKSKADFAFHFETGLSKFVGLHIRNDRFLDNTHTEIMFQFAVIRSKNGMNGFSPIIEFEIPTHKGEKRINSLVGFSTTLSNSHIAFNQVIHYNPREDMVDGSAALVYKVSKRIYLVAEVLGEKMPDEQAFINLLGGIKVRLNDNVLLALAYQAPVSKNKDFTSQYIFQPDLEFKK